MKISDKKLLRVRRRLPRKNSPLPLVEPLSHVSLLEFGNEKVLWLQQGHPERKPRDPACERFKVTSRDPSTTLGMTWSRTQSHANKCPRADGSVRPAGNFSQRFPMQRDPSRPGERNPSRNRLGRRPAIRSHVLLREYRRCCVARLLEFPRGAWRKPAARSTSLPTSNSVRLPGFRRGPSRSDAEKDAKNRKARVISPAKRNR